MNTQDSLGNCVENYVENYSGTALGVECALPAGFTDHGGGRVGERKEAGPASGAAPLLWHLRVLSAGVRGLVPEGAAAPGTRGLPFDG